MKKVIKYTLIFVSTVLILFLILVLTSKIPREKIIDNVRETTECLKSKNNFGEITAVIRNREYTYRHIYADAMLLNIIYYIDSEDPVKSVMEAKYYSTDEWKTITYDFDEMIDNNYQANMQYMRYWHGSMSIIRTLLVFFNINQIYIINAVILGISAIILLVLLIKTRIKELVISYILGLIMCTVVIVPFCLEYYWTFLIMFITSIIAIILDKKQDNLNVLFLITGILTCYLDFLTTEIITFLVPTIIILTIRYKEKRLTNFKNGFKFLMQTTIFWSTGYFGMWISKWILASIILKVNAINCVKNDILFRINGAGYEDITTTIKNTPNLPIKAIIRNIEVLFPFDILEKVNLTKVLPLCIIAIEIIFIRKKDLKKLWFSGLLLLIAIIPYIRYAVLASHSFTHNIFTFRSQLVSIMAIFLSIFYSIDKEIVKKELKVRRKNVFNNINTMSK